MSAYDFSFLRVVFTNLFHQLPVLITCLVAIPLLASRRTFAPAATNWAIAGFIVTAGAAFLLPIAYGLIAFMRVNNGQTLGSVSVVYLVLGALSTLLHTTGYVLLLNALLQLLRPRAI